MALILERVNQRIMTNANDHPKEKAQDTDRRMFHILT